MFSTFNNSYDFSIFLEVHSEPFDSTNPWKAPLLPNVGYKLQMRDGVVRVYKTEKDKEDNKELYPPIKFSHYIDDLNLICSLIRNGPLKSFCFRRLSFLSNKFQLHVHLNEIRELHEQKAVSHRDFYNVRKGKL